MHSWKWYATLVLWAATLGDASPLSLRSTNGQLTGFLASTTTCNATYTTEGTSERLELAPAASSWSAMTYRPDSAVDKQEQEQKHDHAGGMQEGWQCILLLPQRAQLDIGSMSAAVPRWTKEGMHATPVETTTHGTADEPSSTTMGMPCAATYAPLDYQRAAAHSDVLYEP